MNRSLLMKLGSPALLVGLVAVGCSEQHPASLSSVAPQKAERQAAKLAAQAEEAIKARQAEKAVALAEQAVALRPRDAELRSTLGQAYLLAGRFTSAQASFAEAASLDPQPRARFNLALTQIALGTTDAARETLAGLAGAVPEADRGLAVMLAGDREGGIAILERAARAADATAKARQNLALAYALVGRWPESQAVAAQDVPADQLPARLTQWAQLARPRSSWDQVAALLGVTPAEDPGRPVALALADPAVPEGAPAEAVAAAVPTAPAVEAEAPLVAAGSSVTVPLDPAPTIVASVPSATMVQPAPARIASAPAQPDVAPDTAAVAEVPAAEPAPMATPFVPAPVRKVAFVAPMPTRSVGVARPAPALRQGQPAGRWVVQLGAFSQSKAVDAAWNRFTARIAQWARYSPSSSTYQLNSATLHRLTLTGFLTRPDAQRACLRIKVRGGDCFVRAAAGEQPIEWTRRETPTRLAMR